VLDANMSLYKSKNVFSSFQFAIDGIIFAFKTQRNVRIHFCLTLVVIILAFLMKVNYLEWLIIILCIGMVLSAELLNTAIETLVDMHLGDKFSFYAKNAKDIAAGAVLLCSLSSLAIGIIIFLPKIISLI
jgi:undecaprenol kinase